MHEFRRQTIYGVQDIGRRKQKKKRPDNILRHGWLTYLQAQSLNNVPNAYRLE